jgi:hypothetical protein
MASQTHDKTSSEHPGQTADAKIAQGVEATFPASDPAAHTAAHGARAVAPEDMLHAEGSKPAPHADGVTLSLRFPDSESAKLALEAAVRQGPIDRRSASIDLDDDRVTMRLEVAQADRQRLDELLKRHGGMEA